MLVIKVIHAFYEFIFLVTNRPPNRRKCPLPMQFVCLNFDLSNHLVSLFRIKARFMITLSNILRRNSASFYNTHQTLGVAMGIMGTTPERLKAIKNEKVR